MPKILEMTATTIVTAVGELGDKKKITPTVTESNHEENDK